MAIINFILERLKEPSTWRGIIWLLSSFGVVLDPEQSDAIVATAMSLVGLIAMFTSDQKAQIVKEAQIEKTEKALEEYKSNTPDPSVKKPKKVNKPKTSKPKMPKGTDKDNFFNDN